MDYELLLKLKKAGFPMGGGGICGIEHDHMENYKKDCVHVNEPILEELIDWCGVSKKDISGKKKAFSSLVYCGCKECEWCAYGTWIEDDRRAGFLGKTKKEAVAKLGLALHKEVC